MPAIPALIMAGGTLAGNYVGGRVAKSTTARAAQRSPEEQAFLESQTGLGTSMQKQGKELFGNAMPGIRSTLNYYQTLLNGDRAARTAAVAQEAEQTGEAYQGSDTAIDNNLRGGEREQAKAENARQRAGSISRLTTGVRPQAAAGLSGLSAQLLGASGNLQSDAGRIGAGLLDNSTENRQGAFKVGQTAGANTAAQIGKLVSILSESFKGGGKSLLSSRQTGPNMGMMPAGDSDGIGY